MTSTGGAGACEIAVSTDGNEGVATIGSRTAPTTLDARDVACASSRRSSSSVSSACATRVSVDTSACGASTANAVRQRWHALAVLALTASHARQGLSASGDEQSLQYLAPAGFSCRQNAQVEALIDGSSVRAFADWAGGTP